MDQKALWEELGAADAVRAYRALWTMAATPKRSIPALKDRLKLIAQPGDKQVRQLLAQLGNARFLPRETAAGELRKLGRGIEPALLEALQAKSPLEARARLEAILRDVRAAMPPSEELCAVRGIAVLELIGSAEARRILDKMAKGSVHALQTQHARAALQRLKKRLAAP